MSQAMLSLLYTSNPIRKTELPASINLWPMIPSLPCHIASNTICSPGTESTDIEARKGMDPLEIMRYSYGWWIFAFKHFKPHVDQDCFSSCPMANSLF
jgi:hypothetical protein